MKLLYFLAAIGGPNLEKKLKILTRNLIHTHHTTKQPFSIVINCYDNPNEVSELIKSFTFLDNVYFHYRPNSVLSELWFTSPHKDVYVEYDEILFMLDDVAISKLHIPSLIEIRDKYDIDIISPAILGATWSYMLPKNHKILAITNRLEVYCMIMSAKNFQRYLDVNTFENKWIWGVDHMFGYFGINTALYYGMVAYHTIPAAHGRSEEAELLMENYLRKNGFSSLKDVQKQYPLIKSVVSLSQKHGVNR